MESGKVALVLKWVGYLTAIIALFTGIRGIVKLVSDRAESARQVDSLLASEVLQLQAHDYQAAWQSLQQASQIKPDSPKVQSAQETLAMIWLQNVIVTGNQTFSDITEKLEPVLTRGVAASKPGSKQADLLAHIGWTYFLRGREGHPNLDPVATYAKAVEEDPDNPYAQAMWGHWILSKNGNLSEGEQHFSSALASKREPDYVRGMQLSALFNCQKEECEEEIIRIVTAMRKEGRSVSPEFVRRIFSIYYSRLLLGRFDTRSFVNAVPPDEHLATFRWLFEKSDFDPSKSLQRSYYLAALQEAAGQRVEALAAYRTIHTQVARDPGSLLDAVNSGIKRLSR